MKRMDSAPSLPKRKTMDTLMDARLSHMLFTKSSTSSRNETFLFTPNHRKNEIISVIDDVLAVLSDEEGY